MLPTRLRLLFACLLLVAGVGVANASGGTDDEGAEYAANLDKVCAPADESMDKYRYLRSLRLDLTGDVPTPEEYAELDAEEDVPPATIDSMLNSDEFAQRVVRAHRGLLWNNVTNVLLLATRSRIRSNANIYYAASQRAIIYRGENLRCLDEPAQFTDDGQIITTEVDGYQLDGWVELNPFWDLSTPVKVCAFEAQEAAFSPSGTDCSTNDGSADPGCGCGPNLVWCGNADDRTAVRTAMGTDLDLRVADLIANDRPYTELFTHSYAFMNGPLVHYWRYWAPLTAGVRNTPRPVSLDLLPDLAFNDTDTWVKVDLDPAHAGILTSPGYLLRFQTNRGRASQFFGQFLCAPFQAPNNALPVDDEVAQAQPDLQKRQGCKYCHAVLEPSAAYWGRWTQQGAGHLNEDDFPPTKLECLLCAETGSTCSSDCNLFYTVTTSTPEQEAYLGQLGAFLFLREEHKVNVAQGPKLLALSGFADNRLTTCTARRVSEHLLGRPLAVDESDWLNSLVLSFANSDYSYRELMRAVVTSPVYRRVR